MLTSEERKAIVRLRIEKSYKSFEEAKAVAKLGYWNLTGNRLYYAVYYMASALLLDKGFSAKSHAGTIHLIGQKFIVTGIIDKVYGRFFSRLYELRQSGDYDDLFNATREEVEPYMQMTGDFMRVLANLITYK